MNTLLITAIAPLVTVGSSLLVSWLVSIAIIALIIFLIAWGVAKMAGPPDQLPPMVRAGIWIIAAIGVLIFLFDALGIKLP